MNFQPIPAPEARTTSHSWRRGGGAYANTGGGKNRYSPASFPQSLQIWRPSPAAPTSSSSPHHTAGSATTLILTQFRRVQHGHGGPAREGDTQADVLAGTERDKQRGEHLHLTGIYSSAWTFSFTNLSRASKDTPPWGTSEKLLRKRRYAVIVVVVSDRLGPGSELSLTGDCGVLGWRELRKTGILLSLGLALFGINFSSHQLQETPWTSSSHSKSRPDPALLTADLQTRRNMSAG